MPPKLTVPERRAGRTRGKSDPIDALAIARAALREPDLSRPRADEQVFRDLKLLVDHRDDLVDAAPKDAAAAALAPARARPDLRRAAADARPLLASGARQPLARTAGAGDASATRARARHRLPLTQPQDRRARPGARATHRGDRAGAARVARLRAPSPPRSCSPRSGRSTASKQTPNSPATAASRPWKRAQAAANATGSTAAATANSTPRSTGSRSPKPATTPTPAPTSNANKPKARAAAKRSAASNDCSSASSSTHSKRAPP